MYGLFRRKILHFFINMMVYFSVLPHLVNFKTLPAHVKASVTLTTNIIYKKKRSNVPISFHFFNIFLLKSTSLFLSEAFE